MSYLILLLALVAGAITAFLYNRLVRDRNRVDAAWSDIDLQLQRRHDLVPQLVNAVDQYVRYERATVEAVTRLRAEAANIQDVAELGTAEQALSDGLQGLLAIAEQYPKLKANENFLELQSELVEIENYLQFARRYYNGSVREYNTRTESVPSNIIAGWLRFTPRRFFQQSSDDAAAVPLGNLANVE